MKNLEDIDKQKSTLDLLDHCKSVINQLPKEFQKDDSKKYTLLQLENRIRANASELYQSKNSYVSQKLIVEDLKLPLRNRYGKLEELLTKYYEADGDLKSPHFSYSMSILENVNKEVPELFDFKGKNKKK